MSARLYISSSSSRLISPEGVGDPRVFASYRIILYYAIPLILSNSGVVLLQFVDRMFLAWHAPESVAGAGTASAITLCFIGFAINTTAFTNVFAAQYLGSGRPKRLGPAVWQGWYLSLFFGACAFLLSGLADPLFDWIGHGPLVRQAEIDYYSACMKGSVFFMLSGAVMGFFIGRGDNRVVMLAQLGGIVVNCFLDYAMIFGKWGFPEWGVAGAAWATVASQAFSLLFGMTLFWKKDFRRRYATWSGRAFEPRLFLRILRFGSPNGFRFVVELVMWSVFLGLIGLLGDDELAVSNVAFTINQIAWQPMIGVGMAVSMLVGKAQGAGRPELSRLAMRRGMIIAQCWEMLAAIVFLSFPDFLLRLFFADLPPEHLAGLIDQGRIMLRFVAAYCLLDGFNVIFALGLIGAGDSWWISKMTLYISIGASLALLGLHYLGGGLYWYWFIVTLFIPALGLAWIYRYLGKKWETMSVVETVVVEDTP